MKSQLNLRQFILVGFALWLAVHLLFTLLYSFRDQIPIKVAAITDRYMVPLFHQNWKLFAPDLPKYNSDLEYRYASSGSWSAWEDVSEAYGFDKYSTIETVEQGFNSAINWQVMNNYYSLNGKPQFDRLMQSPAYSNALFMVMKMHYSFRSEIPLDTVQIRIHYRFTPERDKARTFQYSNLEFPPYTPQQARH